VLHLLHLLHLLLPWLRLRLPRSAATQRRGFHPNCPQRLLPLKA
jgi:hypothetical protein